MSETTVAQGAQAGWETLVELNEAIRVAKSPEDLPYIVSKIIGQAMGVSQVGFGWVNNDTATLHVDLDYTAPGVQTLAGDTPLLEYGAVRIRARLPFRWP